MEGRCCSFYQTRGLAHARCSPSAVALHESHIDEPEPLLSRWFPGIARASMIRTLPNPWGGSPTPSRRRVFFSRPYGRRTMSAIIARVRAGSGADERYIIRNTSEGLVSTRQAGSHNHQSVRRLRVNLKEVWSKGDGDGRLKFGHTRCEPDHAHPVEFSSRLLDTCGGRPASESRRQRQVLVTSIDRVDDERLPSASVVV